MGPTLAQVTTPALLDVTDLLEFYSRGESSSGVQRVIEGVAPHLLEAGFTPIALDRSRGILVEVGRSEFSALLALDGDRETRSVRSIHEIHQLSHRDAVMVNSEAAILFPGAVWISDAMMLAAWRARRAGARLVYLLYDLTPVMESGHTAAVNMLFDRYLHLVSRSAARVPAISNASRTDFAEWCREHDLPAPSGVATGLPNAIDPDDFASRDKRPWPRPYALMVGTIEARKNHLLAFRAWQQLLERHGAHAVPDLICIGRLGWHADEFLNAFHSSAGLNGKIHLLTSNVSDELLANFYRHAEFTVYPSRYEGWGLPVSESLAFGKVPIVARNSSLTEAGGEWAAYFASEDLDDFTHTIETCGMDERKRAELERTIRDTPPSQVCWNDIAEILIDEVRVARETEEAVMPEPQIELGHEYMVSPAPAPPDGSHADKYENFLIDNARTPLLDQPRDPMDFRVTDQMVSGQFGSPQTWGLEVRVDRQVRIGFTRPVDGPLSMLLSTRSMPGRVRLAMVTPAGDRVEDLYLGSVLRIDLGDGLAGNPAIAYFTVTDANDSIEGFMGIRSLVVMRSDDHALEVSALRASAQALRQELDFLTGTRSWKLTAPLRRRWGRSQA